MRKMTKGLVFILLLAMLLSTAAMAAGSESSLIISAGAVTAEPGGTVTVPVSVTKNPGIVAVMLQITYDEDVLTLQTENGVVNKDLLIRRVNIAACNLISEDEVPEDKPMQLDMFTDYEQLERDQKAQRAAEEKERKLQRVTLAIQDRFGKNAMLKGMNLMEGGTTIDRNGQIGGHKAGDE